MRHGQAGQGGVLGAQDRRTEHHGAEAGATRGREFVGREVTFRADEPGHDLDAGEVDAPDRLRVDLQRTRQP